MQDHPIQQLIATRDKLIQFKILHRIYFTPQRLHHIYWTTPCRYWRCPTDPAGFRQIFRDCLQIHIYCQEVTQFKSTLPTIPVPSSVSVCLLGLVYSLAFVKAMRTLLVILIFYARKAIVLKWKSDRAPSLPVWKHLVNSAVPIYKATYLSQGCPKKFETVYESLAKRILQLI